MRVKATVALLFLVGMGLSGSLSGAEKVIKEKDLPAAVRKTAQEQSQGSIVKGYSRDSEDGKVEYEVQMLSGGHSKDVTIAPDGQLLEIEEQVNLDSLPREVQSGLLAKAGHGKVTKVESLTKHGSLVAYEAQVVAAGKHSEVQVDPEGKALDHEE